VRRLVASLVASATLHGAMAAWLKPFAHEGAADYAAAPPPISASLALITHRQPPASSSAAAPEQKVAKSESADVREAYPGQVPPVALYYTAAEVDIKARPLKSKLSYKTGDNFPLGHIVTVKLRLFINEEGRVDGFKILEAERLPDPALLQDFREIRFYPAKRAGRPVKSQKVVEISFVP